MKADVFVTIVYFLSSCYKWQLKKRKKKKKPKTTQRFNFRALNVGIYIFYRLSLSAA